MARRVQHPDGRVTQRQAVAFCHKPVELAAIGHHVICFEQGGKGLLHLGDLLWPRKSAGDPAVRLNPAMVLKLAPVGLVVGLAAGFFGIGGGFLIAPGLMASTGMTLANAGASSLLSVTLFGGATSASYAVNGQLVWPLFAALVAGGAVGTMAALPLARRLEGRAPLARTLFALMVIAVALYILLR